VRVCEDYIDCYDYHVLPKRSPISIQRIRLHSIAPKSGAQSVQPLQEFSLHSHETSFTLRAGLTDALSVSYLGNHRKAARTTTVVFGTQQW
jgi:hypothetical protein